MSAKIYYLASKQVLGANLSSAISRAQTSEDVPLSVFILAQEFDVNAAELSSMLGGANEVECARRATRILAKEWDVDEGELASLISLTSAKRGAT